MAEQLADADALCNLCETRTGFLVAYLAAIRRGCPMLLPPSGGGVDLAVALSGNSAPVVVIEATATTPAGIPPTVRSVVFAPGTGAATGIAAVTRVRDAPRVRPAAARDPDACVDGDLSLPEGAYAHRVRLFTSGSSGAPQAYEKTLAQLVKGARMFRAGFVHALREDSVNDPLIVCSVPMQHMFGFEVAAMQPLVFGTGLRDLRPLLPADVIDAFVQLPGNGLWVTTPLHLRALVKAGQPVPRVALVVSSTMPLDPALADAAERLLDAPILEYYGSTETGAIGVRRTVQASQWALLDGCRIESEEGGALVWGPHFDSPRRLTDRISVQPGDRFDLLGRHSDLIKIAGRRASLAGLNLLLQELPGLAEGVLHLPSTGLPTERLVLIHTGPRLDRRAAIDWLRARVDAAFLPRAIIRVEQLPRTGPGKISSAALDRICRDWRARRSEADRDEG